MKRAAIGLFENQDSLILTLGDRTMMATVTRRAVLGLVLSAICFTGGQARADFNIEIGNGGIKIGVDGNKERPPQKKYTVRLYRPRELGGGVVYTRSGLTYQQAMNYSSSFEQHHWVVWKYAGIGKAFHSRQFSSYSSAQSFLRNKGPAKEANKLGIAIIAKQYVAKGRVAIS